MLQQSDSDRGWPRVDCSHEAWLHQVHEDMTILDLNKAALTMSFADVALYGLGQEHDKGNYGHEA